MKKFISVVITIIMLISTACANGIVPKFLSNPMTNYTADYNMSITFDNSDEIIKLFEELNMPKEINYFVDLETLLHTLLSYDGKMNLQTDISDDYQEIELALTAGSEHSIVFNPNLNMDIDTKMGMWLNMDLSDNTNPVFDAVYQQPFLNKYMKISSADIFEQDGILDMFKSIFNKEYIDYIQKNSTELFVKHSTVRSSASKYIFTMDNDGFAAYLNEILYMIADMLPDSDETIVVPDLSGLTFLGENGFRTEVTLNGGKLKTENIVADISIDLSKIYPIISGMPWEYESTGKIDFTVSMDAVVSKIGRTKIVFPKLTEDNSFSIDDLAGASDIGIDGAYPETEPAPYPLWYVGEECEYLAIIDGEVYVPLRQTLESAYEDSVLIDYNNDKITISCDYFNKHNQIIVNINSVNALADGKECKIMKPVLYKDKTYVSNTFFTELFDWEFGYASHDLVRDSYQYTFYTDAER